MPSRRTSPDPSRPTSLFGLPCRPPLPTTPSDTPPRPRPSHSTRLVEPQHHQPLDTAAPGKPHDTPIPHGPARPTDPPARTEPAVFDMPQLCLLPAPPTDRARPVHSTCQPISTPAPCLTALIRPHLPRATSRYRPAVPPSPRTRQPIPLRHSPSRSTAHCQPPPICRQLEPTPAGPVDQTRQPPLTNPTLVLGPVRQTCPLPDCQPTVLANPGTTNPTGTRPPRPTTRPARLLAAPPDAPRQTVPHPPGLTPRHRACELGMRPRMSVSALPRTTSHPSATAPCPTKRHTRPALSIQIAPIDDPKPSPVRRSSPVQHRHARPFLHHPSRHAWTTRPKPTIRTIPILCRRQTSVITAHTDEPVRPHSADKPTHPPQRRRPPDS